MISSLARLVAAGSLLVAIACTNTVKPTEVAEPSEAVPDPDATVLVTMSQQAMQLARTKTEDAILRQIDTDLNRTIFHFTDSAATRATQITVPTPETSPDQWIVEGDMLSPLVGHSESSLSLQSLKIGPNRVAQAITAHWPGCAIRGITLYRENDKLTWVAVCNTPEGVVSGRMDTQIGVFQASDAPAASVPITATPMP